MDILRKIESWAQRCPQQTAIRCGELALTYRELWNDSDALAAYLLEHCGAEREPVAVYGHKNPWMLVCFLACVKSGRAYCPIDSSVPDARVELILRALPSKLVLTTEAMQADAGEKQVLELAEIQEIVQGRNAAVDAGNWVQGDDTYYIIFTSGSTGTPKGVQIPADCLNHYLDWSVSLGSSETEKQNRVFLNQAPFSFDLSVMDLYTCLACGGTLYCLEKTVQSDYKMLLQSLRESQANVWVSTPSFAEVCLSEKSYNEELLPELRVFLFCGETLGNRTVKRLQERFPKSKIINTYGPTESTVAVTDVHVTPELAETVSPLPVGKAKPGTQIEIRDEEGNVLPDGEKGEIIILGDTVSTGYYRNEEMTRKAFFLCGQSEAESRIESAWDEAAAVLEGEAVSDEAESCMRGYRTGDKGYLENGMLFYCGRIDLQIKLHGYRIELEDIENNIRKLPGIEHAVVLPNLRDGKVKSLTAYVVRHPMPEEERQEMQTLKQGLLQYVPDYMVPKKFVFLEQMPMTTNGKADRKKLGGNAG